MTGSSRKFPRAIPLPDSSQADFAIFDKLPRTMNPSASRFTLLALAVAEWLLVLPAAVLLLAAALRLLAPRQFEPAQTSWVIFEWATTHISHSQAGLLFIGLPGVAVLAGSLALAVAWRRKEALRQDVGAVLASFRRHFAVAILAAVVAHIIAD